MKSNSDTLLSAALTREQLALGYGWSYRAFRTRLKTDGVVKHSKALTPKDLERIAEKYGHPPFPMLPQKTKR